LPSIAVIGAGGLGCPALLALGPQLAHRGVAVTIIDDDRVDETNLHRQILHRTCDVGRPKAESAAAALKRRWPMLEVRPLVTRVESANADALLRGYDLVIDGTDSFAAKFLLTDVCIALGVPLVHGGVVGFTGQLMTIMPGHACFRCIFEAPPAPGDAPSCQQAGVLGPVCGVIGGAMAREALAILDGRATLRGTLLVFDAMAERWRRLTPRPRTGCSAHSSPEVATW
jgi:adenylyltransferase/sulfurtransferase